jgi:hypothetical protein
MAASTTTSLRHAQWQMMNRLSRRRASWNAADAMSVCGASQDDLIDLEQDGLVRAKTRGGRTVDDGFLAELARDGQFVVMLRRYDVRVGLTAAGDSWVMENPANRALQVVAGSDHGRGGLLRDAAAKVDVDRAAYLVLVSMGLVRVTDSDGHELGPNATLLLQIDAGLRVRLTTRGRELLGY